MKLKRLLFFLLFAAAHARAAALLETGPQLVTGKNDADWLPLFAELGAKRVVASTFIEHRWFPFKKIPVELKGVMRLSPGLGISLGYTEPEARVIVIDDKGLLLREANGRQREIPVDPSTPGASTALLPILNFDWRQLDHSFLVYAARSGSDWRLDFVPRDPQLANMLGRITALGDGNVMRQLEFRRSAMQRVEIFIGETKLGVELTPEEKRRFFR